MADFILRFSTQAQLDGAKETLASVDRIKQSAGEANSALKQINESGGGSEALERLHHHSRAINTELGLLGIHVPEIGHLFHLAFSPQALGIAAFSLAIGEAVKGIKEMRAEVEHFNSIHLDLSGIKGPLNGVRETIFEIKKSHDDFVHSIDVVIHHERTLAEQFETSTAAIERQTAAREKLASMTEDALNSELKLLKERGAITEQEYNRSVLDAKLMDEKNKLLRVSKDEQAAIEARKGESQKEAAAVAAAEDAATGAGARKLALANELKTVEANIETIKKKQIDNSKAIGDKEESGQKLFPGIWGMSIEEMERAKKLNEQVKLSGGAGAPFDFDSAIKARQELDNMKAQQRGSAADLARDKTKRDELNQAIADQARVTTELEGKSKAAADALKKLNDELDKLIQTHKENTANSQNEFREFVRKELFGYFEKPGSYPSAPAPSQGAGIPYRPIGTKDARGAVENFNNTLDGVAILIQGLSRASMKINDLNARINQVADQFDNSRGPTR